MTDRNKNTTLVDLGKLFFSLCVVGIHTSFLQENIVVHSYIFALAVPFFFVVSGYFLGRKISRTSSLQEYQSVLMNYGKRLLVPYLLFGCWYFLIEILANMIAEGQPFIEAVGQQCINWIVSSPGGGLWYVQVILIMIALLLVSDKKQYRMGICILSIVLSVVPAMVNADNNELLSLAVHSHNFLWDGLYFTTGMMMGEISDSKLTIKQSLLLIVAGLFFKILSSYSSITMFSKMINLIIVIGLFCFMYAVTPDYSQELSLTFRRWSTIIYFLHMTVKYGVQMIFKILHFPESNMVFILTVCVLMICIVVIGRIKKDNWFIKVLFG